MYLAYISLQLMVNVGKYTIYMNSMGNWQVRDLSTETSRRWHYNGISVMVIPAFDRESFVMGKRFKTTYPWTPTPQTHEKFKGFAALKRKGYPL